MFNETDEIQSLQKGNNSNNGYTLQRSKQPPSPSQAGQFQYAAASYKNKKPLDIREPNKRVEPSSQREKGCSDKTHSQKKRARNNENSASEQHLMATLPNQTDVRDLSTSGGTNTKNPIDLMKNQLSAKEQTSIFTLVGSQEESRDREYKGEEFHFSSLDEKKSAISNKSGLFSLIDAQKTATQSVELSLSADQASANRSIALERAQNILKIISALTEQIVAARTKELSTAEITLKYPPLFEGAKITIQEFSSAKDQFNITFSELSPDARRIIESQANQQLLQTKLLEQGYTLQMVSIDQGIQFNQTYFASTEAGGGNHQQSDSHRENSSFSDGRGGKREDSFI